MPYRGCHLQHGLSLFDFREIRHINLGQSETAINWNFQTSLSFPLHSMQQVRLTHKSEFDSDLMSETWQITYACSHDCKNEYLQIHTNQRNKYFIDQFFIIKQIMLLILLYSSDTHFKSESPYNFRFIAQPKNFKNNLKNENIFNASI